MDGNNAFRVVFAGKEQDGQDRETVIDDLAALFRQPAREIGRRFSGQPTIIKRGLSHQTAQQYYQAITRAGGIAWIEPDQPAAAECPKCGHQAAHPDDPLLKAGECPACGIVVQKYVPPESASTPEAVSPPEASPDVRPPILDFSGTGPVSSLLGLEFNLEKQVTIDFSPAQLPAASLQQRTWAAVATFCHIVFLAVVLQIPVGIIGAVILIASGQASTAQYGQTLRGLTGLAAILYGLLWLPLQWRGHTFGQRLMGIVLMPVLRDHEAGLDRQRIFLRFPASLLRWCYGLPLLVPLLRQDRRAIEDLISGARQAAVKAIPPRPWNQALQPFAIAIVLHLVMALPATMLLSHLTTGPARSPGPPPGLQQEAIQSRVRAQLQTLRAAAEQHFISEHRFPAAPGEIESMLERHFPPQSLLRQQFRAGNLKIRGDISRYEIGIFSGGRWEVIDQNGRYGTKDGF